MVFVGERRAEERHDPVAHHLVHRALVAVDGLHHAFEDRVKDPARLFGIAVGKQLHRTLQVSEEHRHVLPFAFHGALRRENLLGEMLWDVGFRGSETGGPWTGRGRSVNGRSAAIAELTSSLDLRPTARPDATTECRPALPAESCPFTVLRLAAGTLHAEPPRSGRVR